MIIVRSSQDLMVPLKKMDPKSPLVLTMVLDKIKPAARPTLKIATIAPSRINLLQLNETCQKCLRPIRR